ncbi:MAG: undecaprenyl-diphosphate phosphatase [Clostridia bacterium]|nr:undecaprenyl-diphosphate phosphatase [Clostridia bacterium]MDD4375833.1 undecaprenyl-diphosphate phosphatase [Clostridia bacterium]
MTMIQTIILGIIQGITEFFPISSSGHLIAARYLFNFGATSAKAELIFDIALHFGTFLAIIIYFFNDFWTMVWEGFKFKGKDGKMSFKNLKQQGKLMWYIIGACIPAGIVAIALEDVIEKHIRKPLVVAISMAVMGIIMWIADKYSKKEKEIKNMTFKEALGVGIGQVFAIIPGFSRSGTTMAAARAMKIDRKSAAKFSFLLGAPVMFGATVLAIMDLTKDMITIEFVAGILVSFVVGLIAIKALMKIVEKIGFGIFATYRVILALVIIITMIIR